MSMVSGNVDYIIGLIQELDRKVKKEEDDVEYKNWVEGILQSAIAVLKVAR